MKKLFLSVLLLCSVWSCAQQNTPIDSFLPTVVRFHGAPPLVIPCLQHQIAMDELAGNFYFCNAASFFQLYNGGGGGGSGVTITNVAGLNAISGKTNGTLAVVTDGSSLSDCTVGGGNTLVTCQFSGATWSQLIAASSGSTAFSALTPGTNTSGPLVCGTGCSFTISGSGTNNATHLNGTSLAALGTGLLKNTNLTGVPSIATAGTDYVLPSGNITGTSGGLSGSPSITVNAITATTYNGGAFSGTFTGTPTISGNWAFTGTPSFANPLALGSSTATTQTLGTNNTTLATTAFVIANSTGSFANVGLTNLSAVAVNAALSPGTDATISLDGLSKRYVNAWLSGVYGWTNGSGTADTGISRDAAGVIDFGTGAAGNTGATLKASIMQTVGDGVHASYLAFGGNTANFSVTANTAGFMGPTSATFTGYALQFPSTAPSGTQYLGCGSPTGGVSTCTFNTVSGTGTVTSVATTAPITGGTFTTTGNIACATCVASAAALTLNQLVFGAGLQATAVGDLTGDVTTAGGKATTIAANAVTGAKMANGTVTHTQTDSTFPTLVASGTSAMGTGAITSGTCATVVTTSATGTATTDTIIATPNADPTGVTGYAVSATGSLYIQAYPTTNNVNFKVCNNTAGSLTPAALTLNWKVIR